MWEEEVGKILLITYLLYFIINFLLNMVLYNESNCFKVIGIKMKYYFKCDFI